MKELPAQEPSVAKVIELIGSSPKGWEDAAKNASLDGKPLKRAAVDWQNPE